MNQYSEELAKGEKADVKIMQSKLGALCIYISGLMLVLVAIAKFISSMGNAQILQVLDPVFGIPFKKVFLITGTIEMGIAIICFSIRNIVFRAGILAWLATSFLIYRLCLVWVGYHKLCPCLGNLTDALPVSQQTANVIMKAILLYMLCVSYGILFINWKKRRGVSNGLSTK